jgi:signal transduction histidine kinase
MKQITTLEQAENFIANYDLYKSKAENQTDLFTILEKCESLAITHNNLKLLCQTRVFLTNYYIQINDLENGLKNGLENKNFSEEHHLTDENLRTYSGIIEIYNLIGNYAKMEEIIREYQEKLIYINDYSRLCSLYLLLAMQARNLKRDDDILLYGQKAIEYGKLTDNKNLLLYAYSNFGHQMMTYDIELSKNTLDEALKVIKNHDKILPVYSVAITQANAAKLYLKLNNYELAYQLIIPSIKKLKKINNNNEINSAKLILVELEIHHNKLKNAKKLLQEVENISLEFNHKTALVNCYECYILLYEKKKKFKEALDYYKKLQAVNEEIYNEESKKQIYNLQTQYEIKSIKKQRDHAESIANLKHDFLANMSHEIRTPINSVLGISYLLQQSNLNQKQKEYVERLHRCGVSLLDLINDILDISKIEAGKIELVTDVCNLNTIVQDVYQQMIDKATENNILLSVKSADIIVIADAARLKQIILNLISNAIKFTKKGSVTIELKVVETLADTVKVLFKITDTGIGISEEKLNKIFERYEQASAVIKSEFGGTGLGLSISKRLTELMNGEIKISSIENKGTTFYVEIPFERTAETSSNNNKIIDIDTLFLTKKSILIADDIEENRLIFKEILYSFNPDIMIEEAADGDIVLQKIKKQSFNLILMDLDMPKKNGLEAIQEIRNNNRIKDIKIIAHTASLMSLSKDEILAIGFNDLILKPFEPLQLLEKIANVL